MTEESQIDDDVVDEVSVDGRVARRQRNIEQVLDAALDMFVDDAMHPSIEQIAKRSGLSVRSLYRYFADPGELREAAIERAKRRAYAVSRLHRIGEGPLDDRIADFVAMRLRLWDTMGPVFRAAVANAPTHPRVGDQRLRDRAMMLVQFELQFATELQALPEHERLTALSAGDLLTQLDSIEFLRGYRELSEDECTEVLTSALLALLT